jgi:biopolymer transport protein ExbD
MRWITVALAICICGSGFAGEEAVAVPEASQAKPDPGKYADDRLIIQVTKEGKTVVNGRALSGKELGQYLDFQKRQYDLRRRTEGKSGFEEVAPGVKASRLYVLIQADRETPWKHVQELMVVLAERKIHKVQFAVQKEGDRAMRIDRFLPTDRGVEPIPAEPHNEIVVAVEILIRKEIQKEGWPEPKPFSFRYRYGGQETGSLEAVGKWISGAKKACEGAQNTRVIGRVRAHRKVPFQQIVAVLDRFLAAGLTDVDFEAPPWQQKLQELKEDEIVESER